MRKRFFTVSMVIALTGSLLLPSCIGSFGLTNKLLAWNKTIDSKFINEVVFFAFHVVPVYPVAVLADILVLNSVEFWTGDNPVEAGVVKQVQGENGIYTVTTMENGYNILDEKGNEVEFVYDKASNTWSAVEAGKTTKLVKINDDNTAIVYLPNGEEKSVELSTEGVLAFRQSIEDNMFFASK